VTALIFARRFLDERACVAEAARGFEFGFNFIKIGGTKLFGEIAMMIGDFGGGALGVVDWQAATD
jgi:hypothetical protein